MKTTNFPVGPEILLILLIVASQSANGQDWNDGRGHIKWQMNCDFPGNIDIERIPNAIGDNCGSLCIASIKCTHFRFVPDGNCYLKKAPLSTRPTVVQGGMCGFVPWKFESGRDHWNSDSSGIKWLANCDFFGHDIGRKSSSADRCGEICLANPECNHFRHVDEFCYVKNAPLSTQRIVVNGGVCGYIPSREFDQKDNKEMTSNFEEDFCEYIDTKSSSSAVQPNEFLKLGHSYCLLAVYLLSYSCFHFIGYL